MQDLGTIDVSMKHCVGQVHVKVWEHGDPFPELGPSVGVDTETELITETMLDPPVVVLGVYDNASHTCWIVYWYDVTEFMRNLNCRDVEQRYFNLGFDEQVLDNEDDEASLMTAIDSGRVRDMQIRIHLHQIAHVGWIRGNLYSLAGCALNFLNCTLDKGDPNDPENSARLTFRRFNKDGSRYKITQEHAKYLPFDCISTWCLGEEVAEQPTEVAHTKGMVVLAHISKNGLRVDMPVFEAMEKKLLAARDEARERLLQFGFPDPYKDAAKEARDARILFYSEYEILLRRHGLLTGWKLFEKPSEEDEDVRVYDFQMPKKLNLRAMLCYMYNHSECVDEMDTMALNVQTVAEDENLTFRKHLKDFYGELLDRYNLLAFDVARKGIVMTALVAYTMQDLNDQYENRGARTAGYNFDEAIEYASEQLDKHPDWLTSDTPIGPRKFFQDHVKKILEVYPKLELDTTPKSGDVKLTLKDRWRLDEFNIRDKFLDAYIDFNHCQKYLSTYLNREYVKSDSRVHPRFTNILRTGRVSCSSPNI